MEALRPTEGAEGGLEKMTKWNKGIFRVVNSSVDSVMVDTRHAFVKPTELYNTKNKP